MSRIKQSLYLIYCCFAFIDGFGQQDISKFDCNCSKIGLDSIWADTNKVSCYLIPVERNFSNPGGKQYLVAVASAPAINKHPKDPILYLHGGPGIAALSNFPRYLKLKTFSQLRENHALVFFDYRGTGFSEPVLCKNLSDSINAISNARLPIEKEIKAKAAAYAKCKENALKENIQISDFSSLQSAADAEAIRQALGIKSWNIYSVSHGTTVALNMMRSFPKHISSVILDSPFPPNAPWVDFIQPFDTAFKVLEKSVAQDSVYAKAFPTIKEDYIKITERLSAMPFTLSSKQENGGIIKKELFDDGDFAWSIWSAMLDPRYVKLVPLALKEIANGNDSVLLHWALLFNDQNSFGQFALAQSKAILYYESKPRTKKDTEIYLLGKFPGYASFITPGLEEALYKAFRPESPSKNYFKPVKSNIPALVFSGEYDPVCPPLFAHITAKYLSHSTVIIVPAASHAAMFADECTRKIGKDFFLDPYKKPVIECVLKRKKIEFITSDMLSFIK